MARLRDPQQLAVTMGCAAPQRHVQREAAELATTATLTVTTPATAIAPAASHTSDQHISDCCAKRLTR